MKILVVIDIQNDFIDGSLGTEEAVKILPYVKNKIDEFDGEVVFTMDTHDDNYLKTLEGNNLPIIHCKKGSEGWKIRDGIYKSGCKIFEKKNFSSLDLAKYLSDLDKNKKIESIEIIGLCTDICVVSNVMLIKSFLPEVKIIVDSKACAGVTEESHKKALAIMEICQIKILK